MTWSSHTLTLDPRLLGHCFNQTCRAKATSVLEQGEAKWMVHVLLLQPNAFEGKVIPTLPY